MLLFFNLQSIPGANCPQSRFNVHGRTLLYAVYGAGCGNRRTRDGNGLLTAEGLWFPHRGRVGDVDR